MIEPEIEAPIGEIAEGDVDWAEGGAAEDFSDLFNFGDDDEVDRSGLKSLINTAIVAPRRMPMLDVIFDRTARRMSTSLRQLTDENVEVTLEDTSAIRFGDFLHGQAGPVVIGVMRAAALDSYALVVADGGLVFSVVDLLLGGRRSSFAVGEEGRAFTAIELGLAQRMLMLLIADFDAAFEPVATAGFTFDRIETTPRFAAIAQDASVCAYAKFKVRLDDAAARASILVPHAAIEPVRDRLARDFIGEAAGADRLWRDNIRTRMNRAGLDVEAVVAETTMTLRALANLKPGASIDFRANPSAPIALRAGGLPVATAKLGRAGERMAVKLDRRGAPPQPSEEDAA